MGKFIYSLLMEQWSSALKKLSLQLATNFLKTLTLFKVFFSERRVKH